ncbi:unnamed protein product [Calypogeia fissa]
MTREPIIESGGYVFDFPRLGHERLYKDVKSVVGDRMVTEDDINNLPLLKEIRGLTSQFLGMLYPPMVVYSWTYAGSNSGTGRWTLKFSWITAVHYLFINLLTRLPLWVWRI